MALTSQGRRLTYRQLSHHSTRFAARLHALGVRRGSRVAIYSPRSLEVIIALLGILKAGAAYIALDMESPRERLDSMLAAAEPTVLLTLPPLAGDLPSHGSATLFLNEEFDLHDDTPAEFAAWHPAPDDLAYIAFTSGSSGVPKGVCITHQGVVGLARCTDFMTPRREDTFLQFAPLSFDASTFEIWCCLLNGACLAIFPPWKPSLTDLGEFIETQRISVLWLSAPLFHQMVEDYIRHLVHVRVLITGGDIVSPAHAARARAFLPHSHLINGYGPTENTTFSCCHPIISVSSNDTSIPIGKPVAGTECHILDESLWPVAAGETGELCLGGRRLATGYLGSPELTAARFVPHPFSTSSGERLYRTGDRVRLLPDGNLEFLGRIDRQVKVLGHRVELEEVEGAFRQHPAIGSVSVFAQREEAGDERLIAAVVLKNGMSATVSDLRSFARSRLPAVMIPSKFHFIPSLPLTANGKIDHSALAKIIAHDAMPLASATDFHDPTTARVARIWSFVLGRPDFRLTDDFFALGGNSLRAAHLLARVQKEFRRNIPMMKFFANPTIRGLTQLIDDGETTPQPPVCMSRAGGPHPALFCLPGQGGEMTAYLNTVDHFSGQRTIYGLPSPAVVGDEEGATMEEIAAAHVAAIRAFQPSGPYHLFGFCFGGLLAFEAARQLRASGHEVGFVGVLEFDIHDLPAFPYRRAGIRPAIRFVKNFVTSAAEFFSLRGIERNSALIRVLSRVLAMPADDDDSALPLTPERRLYQLHEAAWRGYTPRAFHRPITILRPRRMPITRPDPTLGWGAIAALNFDVIVVPGKGIHGSALRNGNGRALAQIIERTIARYEAALQKTP